MVGQLVFDDKTARDSSGTDLAAQVTAALQRSGQPPLRKVSVTSQHGHVTLDGRVPTYYMKQLAQTAAMSVDGVESIQNDVKVY